MGIWMVSSFWLWCCHEHLYMSFCWDTCFHFSWSASLFWNTLSFAYYSIILWFCFYLFLALLSHFMVLPQILCAKGYHIPDLGLLLHLRNFICILVLIICCVHLTQVYIFCLEFLSTELYIYLTSATGLILGILKSACPEVLQLFIPLNLVLSHFSPSHTIRS